jgi:Peptidase C39 family
MAPRRAILLIPTVLAILAGDAVTCSAQSVYTPPDCGTNALFLILKLEGMSVGLEEIESALPARNEFGYSMLELQSTARRCGLSLVGNSFGPSSAPLPGPAIAYRPGHKPASGHFVVLRPVGSNDTVVQVIDPPYAPRLIDYPTLFGGNGQPVMILRRSARSEGWFSTAIAFLLGTPLAVLIVAARRIRNRDRASGGENGPREDERYRERQWA